MYVLCVCVCRYCVCIMCVCMHVCIVWVSGLLGTAANSATQRPLSAAVAPPPEDRLFGTQVFVTLDGLSETALNGKSGTVLEHVSDKQRFAVLLAAPQRRILVKAVNLKLYALFQGEQETCPRCAEIMNLSESPSCGCDP